MEKEKKGSLQSWILLALCFLFFISGVLFYLANRNNPDKASSQQATLLDVGFDTPVQLLAYCTQDEFDEYLSILKSRFEENNEIFDRFNEYEGITNIYSINQAALNTPLKLNSMILDCLDIAAKANTLYEKFDVAQGKLIDLWHDFREEEKPLPSQEQIEAAKNPLGLDGFAIDRENLTITKLDEQANLDLGGIAKGYTVEMARKEIEEAGCTSGYINAGGNVALIGEKPESEFWNVGILAPDTDYSLCRIQEDGPACLVTSGDYQRYKEVDGIRYSHIIDPQSGMPAEHVRSVTVINENSAWADAMSTTLFLMDVEQGLQFCQDNDLQAIWFTDHGDLDLAPQLESDGFDLYYTPGLEGKIELSE